MSRVTISLEPQLVRQLDKMVLEGGHFNRSAAVREMIRSGLDRADVRNRLTQAGACVAQVSFFCAYDEPTLATRLFRMLQQYKTLVRTSIRAPFDAEYFLEIIVLTVVASAVRICAEEIIGLKGVTHGTFSMSPLDAT